MPSQLSSKLPSQIVRHTVLPSGAYPSATRSSGPSQRGRRLGVTLSPGLLLFIASIRGAPALGPLPPLSVPRAGGVDDFN